MKKNDVIVAVGLGLAQLALFSVTAHAQDTARVLNDVVVTASRSPKKLSEIGRVVTVISADQISRSQGKTLPQLLNNVPGLTFSGAENAPGQTTGFFLRGASAGNTLILIDGFPVNDASSVTGNFDLNAIAINQIDHIEILKGSGSTLYGSDAVAGVINIITKHPQAQGIKAALQASGGSYNTFNESADINGLINHTGIAINLSNSDSRGFSAAATPDGQSGFDNDGFHQRSVSANITQEVSSKFTLKGNLQFSRNNGDDDYDAFTDDKDYTYKRTSLFAGLGANWKLPAGNLLVNATQNNVWNDLTNLPSDNGSTSDILHQLGRVSNAEAVFNYNIFSFLSITSGAGYKYYSTIQHDAYQAAGYNPGPTSITGHSAITSVYNSFFFKAGIFHMELGGRVNDHNKYGGNFTYTINPSVLLFDRLKVFATMASAYKAPSLYQLYSQYGNPDLKPEKTTASYEAGFDWEVVKNTLSFNTAFYQRKIKDIIYFYYDNALSRYNYGNGDHEEEKGFESELNFKMDKLTASAYMAFVIGKQTDYLGAESHNLFRQPKDSYGVNVNYQLIKTFSVGLNYKYTGNRPENDFTSYPSTIVELKHYNLLDAHLQLQANKKITVFGDLNNILNEKYVDWLGYNTRKFNFMAGIKYQLN